MASSRSMRWALPVFLTACVPVAGAEAVEPPRRPSWESSLILTGDSAAALVIEGKVLGKDGRPLRNVRVHAYARLPWMATLGDRDHWAHVEGDAKGFRCSWDLRLAKTVAVPRPAAFGPP